MKFLFSTLFLLTFSIILNFNCSGSGKSIPDYVPASVAATAVQVGIEASIPLWIDNNIKEKGFSAYQGWKKVSEILSSSILPVMQDKKITFADIDNFISVINNEKSISDDMNTILRLTFDSMTSWIPKDEVSNFINTNKGTQYIQSILIPGFSTLIKVIDNKLTEYKDSFTGNTATFPPVEKKTVLSFH